MLMNALSIYLVDKVAVIKLLFISSLKETEHNCTLN